MHAATTSKRVISLGLTTAMAAVLLAGCAANPAPRADVSASAAERDMARGRHDQAVAHAEAAVAAAPHSAEYRMVLGNTYLDAGRFASAETAFSDAMTLGDASARASLALALSRIAQAKYDGAADALSEAENDIAPADLGLALALAGQPERGIHVMSNAIRGGQNTMKMRQNLAYAYAMAGRWREARLMAAQDVPAGQVNERLAHWARLVPAEAYQLRIAELLRVPAGVADAGQPAYLALSNNPSIEQLAAEAVAAPAPVAAQAPIFANAELPALAGPAGPRTVEPPAAVVAPASASFAAVPEVLAAPAPVAAERDFASAFADNRLVPAPAPAATPVISQPVVQQIAARPAAAVAPRRFSDEGLGSPEPATSRSAAEGTHLVQLGSFLSEAGARRAWNIYVARYPELADREMVITEAQVRGRHYWRVSAGGFDQRASRAMCNRVTSRGGADCITWAANRPLPGAIDRGVMLARR